MTIDPAKLRALLKGGTPRPWRVFGEHVSDNPDDPIGIDGIESTVGDGEVVVIADAGVYPPYKPDADLIVAAVNALPELLEVYEAACAWRDQTRVPNTLSGQARRERNMADGVVLSALHKAIDRAKGGG